MQLAALVRESWGMEFLMQDASARGHPLHIARADDAALAGGISVGNFTLVDDADRFKPAVRVLADTTWFV
jgi:hypothetical protein